jgi:hypothetical protein
MSVVYTNVLIGVRVNIIIGYEVVGFNCGIPFQRYIREAIESALMISGRNCRLSHRPIVTLVDEP